MRFDRILIPAAAAAVLAGCGGGNAFSGAKNSTPAATTYTQSVITVPNVPAAPYWSFDIGEVDQSTGLYYLADRTNSGVDVIDAAKGTYITTVKGFTGNTGKSSTSGPNGVVLIGSSKLYGGDGNGTVKVIDLGTRTVTTTIVIPNAKLRTDEGSYDPDDGVVLMANDSETTASGKPQPLLTFINAKTDTVVAQVPRPDATKGMEASIYVSSMHKFLQAVPATTANKNGEIDVIDPISHQTTAVYPIAGTCGPTGIALGPNAELIVSCTDTGETLMLDASNGNLLMQTNQAGGGDQNLYDPVHNRFWVTNSNNTSNGTSTGDPAPVTTVIDAGTRYFIQNIPSEAHAHSIATYRGVVLVPIPSTGVVVYR